jgi:hypothetical protein
MALSQGLYSIFWHMCMHNLVSGVILYPHYHGEGEDLFTSE